MTTGFPAFALTEEHQIYEGTNQIQRVVMTRRIRTPSAVGGPAGCRVFCRSLEPALGRGCCLGGCMSRSAPIPADPSAGSLQAAS
jgi:hypothetical protein